MPYRQVFDSAACGLDQAAWQAMGARLAAVAATTAERLEACSLPALSVARRKDDLDMLAARAGDIAAASRDVLVLGIGGSSLGGQTLLALRETRHGDRANLHFIDNVDPATWQETLAGIDARQTHVLAVSKSGGTAETLAQALIAVAYLDDALGSAQAAAQVTVVTEPGDRPLRRLADRLGCLVIDHDPDVGGRFSALTGVGLLPVLIAGLDAAAVRGGAATVLASFADDPAGSAPGQGAALAVALGDRGKSSQVVLSYADRLERFAAWHAQIWAESLGKAGKGTTPVPARGVTDQHSQLQLWLDGPRDKWMTILGRDTAGEGPVIDTAGDGDLAYLEGRTLGDLMAAEHEATVDSLAAAGVPLRRFLLDKIDEAAIGALMAHFMLETILAAGLIGIDPFGQPAVEDGKVRAQAKLKAMAR